ncbi:MAG: hypothetical protein OXC44_05975 [Proteobacteria bacterium]|nr:hypothetical protein [Pseudomonadota bacterium]
MNIRSLFNEKVVNIKAYQGISRHINFSLALFMFLPAFSFGCTDVSTQTRESSSLAPSAISQDSAPLTVSQENEELAKGIDDFLFDISNDTNNKGDDVPSPPKYSVSSSLVGSVVDNSSVKSKKKTCIKYDNNNRGSSVVFSQYANDSHGHFRFFGMDDRSECQNHYDYAKIFVWFKGPNGSRSVPISSNSSVPDIDLRRVIEFSKTQRDGHRLGTLSLFGSSLRADGPLAAILKSHYPVYSDLNLMFYLYKSGIDKHQHSVMFSVEETKILSLVAGYYNNFSKFSEADITKLVGMRTGVPLRFISSTNSWSVNYERRKVVGGYVKRFVSRLIEALNQNH